MFVAVFVFDALFPSLQPLGLRGIPQSITLPIVLEIPYPTLAIVLGVLLLFVVALADKFDPAKGFNEKPSSGESVFSRMVKREWDWLPAGILAGALVFAATMQGEYLGIASGFTALTAHLISLFGYTLQSARTLDEHTLWRAALLVGLFPGAFLSAWLTGSLQPEKVTPVWQEAFGSSVSKRVALVFVGGFLIELGALVGGGCTTGALMAGWPTLSVGSFVMGMTFFAVAVATAHVLYWRRWSVVSQVQARGLSLATD